MRLFDAPERKQAADWVVRRFADARSPCPPAVARRVVELVGEDVGDLALETDKLIAYCGSEPPTVEDVERLVIPSSDIKPWDITDAWGRGDAAAVIGLATADVERPQDVGRVGGAARGARAPRAPRRGAGGSGRRRRPTSPASWG